MIVIGLLIALMAKTEIEADRVMGKTEKELLEELSEIGNVSKVWQSYNFMGFTVRG